MEFLSHSAAVSIPCLHLIQVSKIRANLTIYPGFCEQNWFLSNTASNISSLQAQSPIKKSLLLIFFKIISLHLQQLQTIHSKANSIHFNRKCVWKNSVRWRFHDDVLSTLLYLNIILSKQSVVMLFLTPPKSLPHFCCFSHFYSVQAEATIRT